MSSPEDSDSPGGGATSAAAVANHRPVVLIVDDDDDIRALLAAQLTAEHYDVLEAADAAALRQHVKRRPVDLVVLDLGLPDDDGLALCRELRARTSTPIIMLTARGDPRDRIAGLELGADDYVSKPFEPRELLARIRNVLRRTSAPSLTTARYIYFGRWTLDVTLRRLVDERGRAVILSGTEFRLLRLLIDHAGEVLGREQINAMGGSHGDEAQARAADLQVSRLRTKLKDLGPTYALIETVRHKGYVFIASLRYS